LLPALALDDDDDDEEDEDESPPSTEVALEATYPCKSAPREGAVMPLSEKCDKISGDVLVKVAMVTHDERLSPVAALPRTRQVVSGARRWSADVVARQQQNKVQRRQQQQQLPTASTNRVSSTFETTSSQEFIPDLSMSSMSDLSGESSCQYLWSLSPPLDDTTHQQFQQPPLSSSSSSLRPKTQKSAKRAARGRPSTRSFLLPPSSLPLPEAKEDRAPISRYREERRRRRNKETVARDGQKHYSSGTF
jgi:hypothetical protein